MKKHPIALMVCAGCAVLSSGTAAASYEQSLYIGGGPGVATLDPETNNTAYTIDDGRHTGWKVFLGYDLGRQLSLEGYYADLNRVELSPNGSIDYQDYGLSGVFYFYRPEATREGLSAFARLGIGRMKNDTDVAYERDNTSHFMLGAGLEYGLGKGYAVRADFDMYDKDAHLVSLNLMKRFGETKPVPRDSDGDGVPDLQDQCPDTPVGDPVDAMGCSLPRDSDGDGVLDPQDQCPDTPAGDPVDTMGCSLPQDGDGDGDGIPDPQDQCPDTAPGERVDAKGCSLQAVIELKGVVFATGSAELIGDSGTILDDVAKTLKRYPDLHVQVAGHTDSQGNAAYNKQLSSRRANAVRDYLVAHGVSADNLTANGYGEENPIADNDTAEGRAQNRRVELHLLK